MTEHLHWTPEQLTPDTWRTGTHYTDDRDRRWRVIVDWATVNGRLEPTRVDIGSMEQSISADAIRRLPLATIFVDMQRHAEQILLRVADGPAPGGPALWEGEQPTDDLSFRAEYRHAAATFGVQRGRRLSNSVLEEVAVIYRTAYAARRPVTAAVADQMGCSKSMASKRIMAARRAGLLDGVGPKR